MTTAPAPVHRLVPLMVVSVVIGAQLVYFVWEEINELLTGPVEGAHLGIALGALVLLLVLLRIIAGRIRPTPPSERP